jgi:hypothetical protein
MVTSAAPTPTEDTTSVLNSARSVISPLVNQETPLLLLLMNQTTLETTWQNYLH